MDLITTTYCPNNCSYCFSSVFSEKKDHQHIDEPAFDEYLQILQAKQKDEIRFFGGEPFSNPQFEKLLLRALQVHWIKKITIFTSGVISKHTNLLDNEKITVVVNTQVPHPDNPDLPQKTISFLERVSSLKCQLWISLNFYRDDHDIKIVEKKLNSLGISNIRFSFATSAHNHSSTRAYDLTDYSLNKKAINSIYSSFSGGNYTLHFDGALPLCSIPQDIYASFSLRWKSVFDTIRRCQPPFELFPDQSIRPCANLTSLSYKQENSKTVEKEFYWEFSRFKWYPATKKCKKCNLRISQQCQMGCLGTRDDLIDIRKKYLTYKVDLDKAICLSKDKNYSESNSLLKKIDKFNTDYFVQGLLLFNFVKLKDEASFLSTYSTIDKAYLNSPLILFTILIAQENKIVINRPRREVEEKLLKELSSNIFEANLINTLN